jgi:uncharacterized membrane protein
MIIYCGDGIKEGSAGYLSSIIQNAGLPYEHIPSNSELSEENLAQCSCLILSDFPHNNISTNIEESIIEKVKDGMGFLMIGGWESFHGKLGEYHQSKLNEILAVECLDSDDRINFSQPCLMITQQEHPIVNGLGFHNQPPLIGGLNRVSCKKNSLEIISARSFSVDGDLYFKAGDEYPLLVTTEIGKGRSAAFMSDVAPHWVGGFVDWGPKRINEDINGFEYEFGDQYCKFFQQLINWCQNK